MFVSILEQIFLDIYCVSVSTTFPNVYRVNTHANEMPKTPLTLKVIGMKKYTLPTHSLASLNKLELLGLEN